MYTIAIASLLFAGVGAPASPRPCLTPVSVCVTAAANSHSYGASVSESGNKIAFYSQSTNLATGATNPCVLAYDYGTATFTNCSANLVQVSRPLISRDGRYVVFYGAPANTLPRAYVYDLQNNVGPTAAPIAGGPSSVSGSTFPPGVSDSVNGNYFVVFPEQVAGGGGAAGAAMGGQQRAGTRRAAPRRTGVGIAAGGGGGLQYIQIRLWQIGTTTTSVISYNQTGVQASGNCSMPLINADATKCAYISPASNLINNSSGIQRIFRTNLVNGVWRTTTAVFTGSEGTCSFPTISKDGDTVAYEAQTGIKAIDVWVYKASTGTSTTPYDPAYPFVGDTPEHITAQPNLSPNGKVITFVSYHTLSLNEHSDDNFSINNENEDGECLEATVYVKLLVDPYTITMEACRVDGIDRYRRSGRYPGLSRRVLGNIEYYDVVFNTPDHYIVNDPAEPIYNMVYVKTEVASTTYTGN